MPYRNTPLVIGQYYHVYNRGVAQQPMFIYKRDCQHFIKTIWFYHFINPSLKFSRFNTLAAEEKSAIENQLSTSKTLISLHAFCIMPNHFHFLLKQEANHGISTFIKNTVDSYTRFYNIKHKRNGPLFQGQFKAVLVESNEQLLHLSRYIHLNPFTSYLLKNFNQLKDYPWSSLKQYLNKNGGVCQTDIILNSFRSKESYFDFLADNAEYQRKLETIKHLTLE